MTIWIVVDSTPYDGGQPLAVFSTLHLAEMYAAKYGGDIDEWEVDTEVE